MGSLQMPSTPISADTRTGCEARVLTLLPTDGTWKGQSLIMDRDERLKMASHERTLPRAYRHVKRPNLGTFGKFCKSADACTFGGELEQSSGLGRFSMLVNWLACLWPLRSHISSIRLLRHSSAKCGHLLRGSNMRIVLAWYMSQPGSLTA